MIKNLAKSSARRLFRKSEDKQPRVHDPDRTDEIRQLVMTHVDLALGVACLIALALTLMPNGDAYYRHEITLVALAGSIAYFIVVGLSTLRFPPAKPGPAARRGR